MGKTAQRERRKAISRFLYEVHSSQTEWKYKQMTGQMSWEQDYKEKRAQYEYHVRNATAQYEYAVRSAKAQYEQTKAQRLATFETAQRKAAADLAIKRAQSMQLDVEQAKELVETELALYDAKLKAKKEEADVAVNVAAFAGGVSSRRLLSTMRAEGAEAQATISLKSEMQQDIMAAQRVVLGRQAEATQIIAPYIEPVYVEPKELTLQDWVEPLEYIDPLYIRPHDPTSEAFSGGVSNFSDTGLTVGLNEDELSAEYLMSITDLTPQEIEDYYGIPQTPETPSITEEETEVIPTEETKEPQSTIPTWTIEDSK